MNGKKRILIVDDNQSLVLGVQRVLQKNGFEVLTAFNGPEGLEKARKEKPDLAILDIMMPEMDGYTLCKLLKAEPCTTHIPVIFLSVKGETDETRGAPTIGLEEISNGYKCGARNFLTKPVTASELLRAIRNELLFSAFLGENRTSKIS